MKYDAIRREKEKTLINIAEKDYLTGIYNRRKFFHSIKKLEEKSALLLMDLDNFKKINDTYGHDTGDKVLKAYTSVIMENIRKEDIFARIGGEEFVLVLKNVSDKEKVYQIAEKLRELISKREVENVNFTVSIGVTLFLPNKEDIKDVLKRADIALYEAKRYKNKSIFI
jgi:diguanylate cyclase (GGDEF)-like protein